MLCALGASAQNTFLPPPSAEIAQQQGEQLTSYLTKTLRLETRQVPAVRAAVMGRLGANSLLGCLCFVSGTTAAAAYTTADCRYYAEVSKVLTPTQFHDFLKLDEGALPDGVVLLVGSR